MTIEELLPLFKKQVIRISERKVYFKGGTSVQIKKCTEEMDIAACVATGKFSFLDLKSDIETKVASFSGYQDRTESGRQYPDLIPILDLQTSDVVMWNGAIATLSTVCYESWSLLNKGMENTTPIIPGVFDYNPYENYTRRDILHEDTPALEINLHKFPEWRNAPHSLTSKLPLSIEKFFLHLFPDPVSYEYAMFWMKTAIISRNEVYLVLNGSKGIGKGVLTSIIKALVGRENYGEVPVGIFESNFNSILRRKRVILFDEIRVDKKSHLRLKRFANKYQNIERKGVDADVLECTFNSYIISNNDISDMYLECDDRRFSVLDMNDLPLLKVMTADEITELTQKLEDDQDFIGKIGNYILNYPFKNPDWSPHKPFINDRFYSLAYHSLSEWQKNLVDKFLSKCDRDLSVDVARKEFQKAEGEHSPVKFPRDLAKIESFLKNYSHYGKGHIGVLVKDPNDGKWYIKLASNVAATPAPKLPPKPVVVEEDIL